MKLKDIISGKPLTEAKSAKALRAEYDKAVKKEQTLSSLLLVNLEKYKAAKAKGDEKAIAKHTKIAGDLGKKKKKATADASAAYKAYEAKISGLHADAELELKESVLGQMPSDELMKMKWNPLAEAPQADITGGAAIGDDGTERGGAEFSQQIKAKLGRAKGKLAIAFGSLDDKTVERLSKLNVQQQVELVATLLTAFGIDEKSFRQLRQRVLKQLQEPQEES